MKVEAIFFAFDHSTWHSTCKFGNIYLTLSVRTDLSLPEEEDEDSFLLSPLSVAPGLPPSPPPPFLEEPRLSMPRLPPLTRPSGVI